MITAKNFIKAIQAQTVAQQEVKQFAPNADFVFVGADNERIYFNVVALSSEFTAQQRKDLNEKTRFQNVGETNNGVYEGKFVMSL